jgi:long-chain acyl-CoA synthetase
VPAYARFTYLGAPDQTAAAWRDTAAGPAFTVGDVGRVDDDGYVFLDGRRTDLIITGGVNVYPLEVEQVVREAPGVDDVAVFGAEDEEWGQRVCAAVVGSAPVASLEAHARAHLAPAKRPKTWLTVAALPLTATGKVRRDRLVDLL